jgi:hypothetical protein
VDDWHLSAAEEAERLRRADVIVAIQAEEHRHLSAIAEGRPVVTAGIDFDLVADAGIPSGHRILYVASANPMNVKGLHEFLRFAWPVVRRAVPDAEFVVAGSVCDALPIAPDGVTRLGQVPSLEPLYRDASATINPAVAGTGMKIKTVEALCHQRPIVTWPNGVDGLPAEIARLCLTVEDWYSFGRRVIDVLTSERRPWFSRADRQTIERAASTEHVYRELTDTLHRFFDDHAVQTGETSARPRIA